MKVADLDNFGDVPEHSIAETIREHVECREDPRNLSGEIVMRIPEDRVTRWIKRLPEILSAGSLMILGMDLSPGNSFEASHIYDTMGRIASEHAWMSAAISLSTVRLIALALNGFFPVIRRVTPAVRSLTAFASGCMWGAIGVGLISFNGHLPGIAAHLGMTAFDFTYGAIVAHEATRTIRYGINGIRRR